MCITHLAALSNVYAYLSSQSSICELIRVSDCLSTYWSVRPSVNLHDVFSILSTSYELLVTICPFPLNCLFVRLFVFRFVSPSVCLFIDRPFCSSTHSSVCPLFFHRFIRQQFFPSIRHLIPSLAISPFTYCQLMCSRAFHFSPHSASSRFSELIPCHGMWIKNNAIFLP